MQLLPSTTTLFQRHPSHRLIRAIMLVCTITVAWISAPLAAAAPSTIPAESTATEAVKSTVTELIQVLDDTRLKAPERAEQRRHEIERIVRQRVSYEEMAKRALGAPWSGLVQKSNGSLSDCSFNSCGMPSPAESTNIRTNKSPI